ncbi:NAD(P)/FAD-dependent oxidoreductase [Arthrobacter sp. JSM 101049]|uniref:NAD(P)/FAD-dependent oxidoreductase n=1 Tax=Arthrobacter sp. JSM 101049 TaxID=929097 RepID=UPI003565C2AD
MDEHHRIVMVGGGNAGISLAARLLRKKVRDVAIIEPRSTHYFQPLFSHVGAGAAGMEEAQRPQAAVMPRRARWIQGAVSGIRPEEDAVILDDGRRIAYDQLVVCPGVQLDWQAVPGLRAAMDGVHGTSNYDAALVPATWELVRGLRRGTAVFTQPPGPAKCSGAAQKIAYMACDYWREQGVLEDIDVYMVVATPKVFGMPDVDAELERKIAEYGITLLPSSRLVSVDAAACRLRLEGPTGSREIAYDLLHVEPQQSAPDWLKATTLPADDDDAGFVEVDDATLRHRRYPNVWSLGDAAGTSNSKSGGALRKQTKVVDRNLRAALEGRMPPARYNGYSVCPFTLSRGTAFFAEFGPDLEPMPSYPWLRMAKERRWQWVVDRHVFPQIYWHLILKGRA